MKQEKCDCGLCDIIGCNEPGGIGIVLWDAFVILSLGAAVIVGTPLLFLLLIVMFY